MKKFSKILACALALVTILSFALADELTLSGQGQVRAEGGVYRVNLYNSWTNDANDTIVTPADFAGANKISVTFTVSGLGDKSGKFGINMSNSDWGEVQYWFDDNDRSAVVSAEDVTVSADGTYTVSLSTVGDYLFDELVFIDLQSDIAADEDEADLEITSGISITIDKVEIEKPAADADTTTPDDTTTPADTTTPDDSPKTGDATSIVVLAVVAVLAMGGVVVSSKKRA